MSDQPHQPWARRIARQGLSSLAVLLVFSLALCMAIVLHANTSPVRSVVTQQANALLSTALYGRVEIERITALSIKAVELTRVALHDELGNVVVELETVRIELDSISLLTDILFDESTLNVVISHARAEHAVVRMIPAPDGELTLERAFTPRPRPKRDPSDDESSDRYVRVWLPLVELGVIDGEVGIEGWEQLGLLLAGVRGKLLFSPKGIAVDVDRFGANITGLSDSTIRGTGTYMLRAPGPMQVEFTGRIDDSEVQANARLEGDVTSLEVTAPRVRPEMFRKLVPEWPLLDPLSLRLSAQGRLPQLDTRANVVVDGGGEAELSGIVNLSTPVTVQVDAEVSEFNLQTLARDAPSTSISARCNVGLELSSEATSAALVGTTDATQIGGVEVPATEFDLAVDELGVSGNVHLQEPGAPLTAEGSYRDGTLTLDAHVTNASLNTQRRVPRGISGVTALDAKLVLDDEQLELEASGSINHLAVRPLTVARVEFETQISAPLADLASLTYEVDARVTRPEISGYGFDRGQVRASGNADSVLVDLDLRAEDGRQVAARGRVFIDTLAIRNATLRLSRSELELRAEVRHLDLERSVIDAPMIEVDGPQGRLRASVDFAPGRVQGQLSATNLDLGRLTSQLRLGSIPVAGSMNVEAEVSIGEDVQHAKLRAGASKVSIMNWGRSDLSVTADLDGHAFAGTINGKDEMGFTVQGNWNAQLGGHPLTAEAWSAVTGTSELGVLGVDLAPLALAIPNDVLSSIDGKLGVRTLLQRTSREGFPNAFVEVGASIEHTTLNIGESPTQMGDVELYMNNAFDAANERLTSVTTAGDLHGQLFSVSSSLEVQPRAWLDDAVEALRDFRKSDLSVTASVPQRWLSHFPGAQLEGTDGIVEGQVAVYGTLIDPRVSLQVSARKLRVPNVTADADLAVNLTGSYAPQAGDVDIELVGSGRGRSLVLGKAQGNVPWVNIDRGEGWNLSGRFFLDRLPLNILSPLVDNQLTGEVSGQLELAQGDESSMLAHLSVDRLTSGRAVLGSGVVTMKGSPGELLSTVTLKDGERLLTARASASAKTKQVPMPAQLENVELELQTRRLDAGALGPLLEDVLARLSGDLDSNLTISLTHETSVTPGTPHHWNSALTGEASLSNASAYVDSLGLELSDMSVQLTARADRDRTEIELSQIQAKARSDDVNVEGQGQLNFENSRLVSGTAGLRLRSVPITLQGLNLGKARGQALIKASRQQAWDGDDRWMGRDYLQINVDLLDWQMRATPSASRELIELDRSKEIVVVQQQVAEKVDPNLLPLRVIVDLGPRATFNLADLEIPLGGKLQIDQTDKSVMRGTLKLQRGGRIPIFGHVFTVVDGKLRLDPKQPSNPTLDITLNGRNTDGQPVDLHIGGTLKEPRTDPAPDELQALLGGGAGAALSGGVQALGVNQLLGESVQLRVDSATESEEVESSYTAAVQIDDDLWFEANYQRGQDNTLNQDQSDILSGTVDYRFHSHWSLRTKVGTTGGSVDLLWQYRY